ncbi:hypothetical protein [Clostridium drakei]|uniref:Uncharacterized protein n=1 Tax=Clostridium drakei TaxID=332101 RepID=A0A2U8DLZ7_9CLOT|nr:hypothetical protein [Clostridium drakei]AWI03475.1 hypothetical protein B9W14_02900 [Clostridium drakei]
MNHYKTLYNQALNKISNRPVGKFELKDLLDDPPCLLGVWLYKDIANKKIKNVKWIMKTDVNVYEKY